MIAWVDAAGSDDGLRVFGLGVLERHLQALARIARKPELVVIELGEHGQEVALPEKLLARLAVEWRRTRGDFAARLAPFLADLQGRGALLFDATMLADARLAATLAPLAQHTVAEDAKVQAAVVHLAEGGPAIDALVDPSLTDLAALAGRLIERGRAVRLQDSDFDGFIRKLRRSVPYYLFKIDGSRKVAEVEHFMFWSNYKGSTDVLTRYLYPPLVWLLVRPLARLRVHPNVITILGIVLAFAAIPCWSAGWFATGFLLAYAMSVLDSVDGKLARLTFTDSKLGNTLDHGLDMVHPPLWYLAWADGLGLDFDELGTFLGQAAIAVAVCYACDRAILKIYPRFFQRAFHTHSRMDGLVRSVIARRNITLSIFMLGYVFGLATEAFYVVVTWQVATMLYHGLRTFWIFVVQRAHLRAQLPTDAAAATR